MPGPPGIPVQTMPSGEFMSAPPSIWPRPYMNAGGPMPPPADLGSFPPPASPLVSQAPSPTHSRPVSPTRAYSVRPPAHIPVMDRIPPLVKENVCNVGYPAEYKTVPNDEVSVFLLFGMNGGRGIDCNS